MDKQAALSRVRSFEPLAVACAAFLWDHPEVAGSEQHAIQYYKDIFTSQGFRVTSLKNLPTAFYAEYGSGGPVIAILGEYDALYGLSQSVKAKKEPVTPGGAGHGCGHNLLGAAGLCAALAAKALIDDGMAGTIRFYGCPEEETLSGKAKMLKEGAFAGCDLALSWHPLSVNAVYERAYLASDTLTFRFKGVAAHASYSPHLGRSAWDAVELMSVGANYLREHIPYNARVHYSCNNLGYPPNIVPPEAECCYMIRAAVRQDVNDITARLRKIAAGAALMTETEMSCSLTSGSYDFNPNDVLTQLNIDNMRQLEFPRITPDEARFAKELQQTVGQGQLQSESACLGCAPEDIPVMCTRVLAQEEVARKPLLASSDSGDVSYNMPMQVFSTACLPLGCVPHTWQATAACGSSIGHKGMRFAAEVLLGMIYDLLETPSLVERARAEFDKRMQSIPYVNPLDMDA